MSKNHLHKPLFSLLPKQSPIVSASTSRELLRLYQQGDSQVAAAIFDRYVERLVALACTRISAKLRRRIDPEDVVQSAYRSFFVHAANEEYVLAESGDLWRLLASITLNKLHGHVEKHTAARRSINREDAAHSSLAAGQAGPEPTPAEVVAVVEQLHLVCERLAPAERTAFTARLKGRTVDEIGAAIGKSPRTVRRLLAEAQRQIERELASGDNGAIGAANTNVGLADDPRVRLAFSDYVLERLVGVGGMGKVYRATHRTTGRRVAVKALLKSRQGDGRAVEKFLQEAQILARLDHPNIVRLKGVGRFPGGGYFLVMEYIEGTDLQTRIARGPLGMIAALQIVETVTSAIGYAHEQGVVHGDLKPANVLLDRTGRVVVTDFGLGDFIVNNARPKTPSWIVGGTIGYIAPEVQAYAAPPTPSADVYGLGALLWALTKGSAPSGAASLAAGDPDLSPLSEILRRCLAHQPEERFQRASDILQELQAVLTRI